MYSMSSVESVLTRELDVRFIDAHEIVNEAKVSLGLHGYPNQRDFQRIHAESVRLFYAKSKSQREDLRRLHWDLETIKSSDGAHSCDSNSTLSTSEGSTSGRRLRRVLFRRGDL